MTITETYIHFKKELTKVYDEREAGNITEWVVEKVTGLAKWELRNNQTETGKEVSETLNNYLQQLLNNKPVQYVLHEAWFYKRKFYVNEHVLIPRPETEELAEWIIKDVQQASVNEISIIDIGTGSGCIPVTLKKELPKANITAIDVSKEALLVANTNATAHDASVHFLLIDFLDENDREQLAQYDIIVSNPPYIPFTEKNILHSNVRDFEPSLALFVPDLNPFIFYEMIASFAQKHLLPNGKVYVEMHEDYADEVKQIFEREYFETSIKKDIYGKERMLKAFKK